MNSALVYHTTASRVFFVTMRSGSIEHMVMSKQDFARDFCFALPNYPLRRAARIYEKSFLPKSERAARELRIMQKG